MSLVRFRFWALGFQSKIRGCSSMVEHQPSKLDTWVRFPSPASAESICKMQTSEICASGSVGGARPCQGRGRGFESRLALSSYMKKDIRRMSFLHAIEEQARAGYAYAGYFSVKMGPSEKMLVADLIFLKN